jgi:hypothetical protein
MNYTEMKYIDMNKEILGYTNQNILNEDIKNVFYILFPYIHAGIFDINFVKKLLYLFWYSSF